MTEHEQAHTADERRLCDRARIHAVVGIDSSDRRDRVGITRNLSSKGALFHSASQFRPGETLSLHIRAPGEETEKNVAARVVRTALDEADSATIFRHLTAVEFDQPLSA